MSTPHPPPDAGRQSNWPYTVRLHGGTSDHKVRQRRGDGVFETACPAGTFTAGSGDLTRSLSYRPCHACTQRITADRART
ncbi:hypothetical protein ACWGJ2_33185 [Streptomyces sp. NPDC054796]